MKGGMQKSGFCQMRKRPNHGLEAIQTAYTQPCRIAEKATGAYLFEATPLIIRSVTAEAAEPGVKRKA
jgi:hypothetical protein